jgi:hypothetical protein
MIAGVTNKASSPRKVITEQAVISEETHLEITKCREDASDYEKSAVNKRVSAQVNFSPPSPTAPYIDASGRTFAARIGRKIETHRATSLEKQLHEKLSAEVKDEAN